ncbi:hypothetical protein DFQ28_003244 [Apophysomyces sp. BC1034]|nr:hypothetical protein DFQ30_006311 [Apophysomyces sp. BC1015]KAG0179563.1 hypothetical protein DFQ29_001913 [Apophysomyces sp. BC1021]KAG0189572.1 hypothetical protein DFQ28_003244 [Apophysomyces sp. BC1034]
MTDSGKFVLSTDYMADYTVPQYSTKVELSEHPMSYQEAGTFGYVATSASNAMATMGLCTSAANSHTQLLTTMDHLLPDTAATSRQSSAPITTTRQHQGSPDTPMSSLASCCTSPAPVALLNTTTAATPLLGQFLPYSPTSPSTSPSPSLIQPTSASSLTETLARASSFPDAFYPEFLQYSKETPSKVSITTTAPKMESIEGTPKEERASITGDWDNSQQNTTMLSNSELRRQIHIQSEQKRRAQIKDGFEDLRNELPSCLNKKMSKVALLHRTHPTPEKYTNDHNDELTKANGRKRTAAEIRIYFRFQESVLQKQAMDKMYQINTL